MLALKSDPLKPRFDQIRKQAEDHKALALTYAVFARKLKLENSKLVRVFAELSQSYNDLLSKPSYQALLASDALSIDEYVLRQFEKEVKEKNLLIGKLRHEAIVLNDHLTKALRYLKKTKPEDSIDRFVLSHLSNHQKD